MNENRNREEFRTTIQLFDSFGKLIDELTDPLRESSVESVETYEKFRLQMACSNLPITNLFLRISTTPYQEFVILLSALSQYIGRYQQVYATLNGNAQEIYVTPEMAAMLARQVTEVSFEEVYELTLNHNLLRRFFRFPRVEEGRAAITRPLIPRQSFLNYLFGVFMPADELAREGELFLHETPLFPMANEPQLSEMVRFAQAELTGDDEAPAVLVVSAPEHGGKSFSMAYLASQTEHDVMSLDCRSLLSMGEAQMQDLLEELICYCLVWESIPACKYFDRNFERPGMDQELFRILEQIQQWISLVMVSGEKPYLLPFPSWMKTLYVSLNPFTQKQQLEFWKLCGEGVRTSPGEDVQYEELSDLYSFAPGDIERIMLAVDGKAMAAGSNCFHRSEIVDTVRMMARSSFANVAVPMKSSFRKSDIMLSEEASAYVEDVINSARYAKAIREEWGFDRLLPYGNGISVLLYGPPGTGKTMLAQVLAAELGLDAYRIDLSQVVDKYIGETEKKLAGIFDAAQNSNAILFFDEADAIFGKRTEISDSKDRYANVETAYLLQRIEEHNGISILATNIAGNFDNAFKRRIKYMIHVDMPEESMRLKLWNQVFPEEAPVDRSNFPKYASNLEITGSNIKNIAVSAANLAMAEHSTIRQEHIIKSIRQEYRKLGMLFSESDLFL